MRRRVKDPLALIYSLPKADFEVLPYYTAGQGVNEDKCAVRITHRPSGAVGQCGEERRQPLNKRRAFEQLTETKEFKSWQLQRAVLQLSKEN